MGEIGDERAVPALIDSLHRFATMTEASRALAKIGTPAVPALIKALKEAQGKSERKRIVEVLKQIDTTEAKRAVEEYEEDK